MQDFIFSIDIKIGDKNISIGIQNKDTLQSVVQKLQQKVKFQLNSKTYREKIIQYLNQSKHNQNTSNELRNKIQQFLKSQEHNIKNYQSSKENQQSKQNNCQENNYKMTDNLNKNSTSQRNQSKMLYKNNKNPQTTQQHQIFKLNVQITEEKRRQQKYFNTNKLQKKHNETHKKKQVDQDLIKAYQVIYKKCKDKQMRQIAQNSLRKLGKLKNDTKVKQSNIPTNTTIIYNANLNQDEQEFQNEQSCQPVVTSQLMLNNSNTQNIDNQKIENEQKSQLKHNKNRINDLNRKKFQYSCLQQSNKSKLIYSYGAESIELKKEKQNQQKVKPNRFKYL